MGVLSGKTVLVTGAGGGIGLECALLAAREGAWVVVNDLGGGPTGREESEPGPAKATAASIVAAGGEAVWNAESVADLAGARRMVEQALDCFGGLHAVINPAGILRDRMLHKMAEEDWDAVVEVHLKGAFNVSRASIEHFRQQEEGAYVHFVSTSGLIGNVGQSNYAAAKLGVMGLSPIIALEGDPRGVTSNVIAPFAWTRLVAGIPIRSEEDAARAERMRSLLRAEQVAPLAVALASPAGRSTNGQIFIVRGNEIVLCSQPRPVKSMSRTDGWSPETVLGQCLPAMASSFTALEPSSTIFPYEPV